MTPTPTPTPAPDRAGEALEPGRGFWLAAAAGGAVMAWGVVLYLDATPDLGRRLSLAVWAFGLNLLHDLVAVPVVLFAGAILARVTGTTWRAPLQLAMLTSAAVLLVAAPPLLHTAAVARNPTIQPLDYRVGTLVVLAGVWATTLAWGLVRRHRR